MGDGRDPRRPVDREADQVTPSRPLDVRSAPPLLMPIRTRIGASSGHGSAASARWPATAAAIAIGASRKTTKNESPSVPCSLAAVGRPHVAEQRPVPFAELGVPLAADPRLEWRSSPRCRRTGR